MLGKDANMYTGDQHKKTYEETITWPTMSCQHFTYGNIYAVTDKSQSSMCTDISYYVQHLHKIVILKLEILKNNRNIL